MANTNGNTRVTIASVEAENFRRLRVAKVEFVPGTGLVRVTGENAAGKTSLLKAIAGALGGAGEVHESSLHEGAESGRVTLKLTNGFTVERRITEAAPKGYLTVTGPDDGRHQQGKLNTWLGERAFDPLAFVSLDPKRQREVLFSIGTDPGLPRKLQEVRDEHAEVYERRTPVISRRRHLGQVEKPEGERPEPVDTSAEMEKLREIQAHNRDRGDLEREARDAEQAASGAVRDLNAVDHRIEDLLRQVEDLRAEREEHEERRKAHLARASELREKLAAVPDRGEEAEAVQARLAEANRVQEAIEPWKRWEAAQKEAEELAVQESQLTEQLGALKRRESDLLEKAGIPIPGLSFDEDGSPLLNGRPLEVASGRERIEVAVQVALAANPELGICLLDEANDLDLAALERLDQLAKEHGFQIWAVRIGLEGPGEIVVEDGVAQDREGSGDPQPALALEGEG